ncbi:extracellular solute-binding protein [Brachybacterium muris]|uniref:extracellular solute-binding protein n=1 Tax=Brachybacterium muris TaxID=219301 RepID=UPI00223BCE29|nr:extracellular solute-binding protein [Brachybacterium muris]MCT1653477.1 extracellular solute-binding protein [Brachybacterium muris]
MTKVADIVQRWNDENPDIQVSTQKFDGSAQESYAKIAQAVSSGDAPDLAQVGYGEIASEYLAGHLEDVAEGAYYWSTRFDGSGGGWVRDSTQWIRIQLSHRSAFVRAEDVVDV